MHKRKHKWRLLYITTIILWTEGERCLTGSSSNLCSEIRLPHLLCLSLHLVLSSVCLLHLDVWQRRWPSCRSTWPCSGRSMWRCSRSWPTQKGAVPCSLPRPPARVPPAPRLQTPSLAVCWTSWLTSISRNSTGDEHGIQLSYYSFMCDFTCDTAHSCCFIVAVNGRVT